MAEIQAFTWEPPVSIIHYVYPCSVYTGLTLWSQRALPAVLTVSALELPPSMIYFAPYLQPLLYICLNPILNKQ